MTLYYVYILYSLKDQRFYVGKTKNIVNRLIRHNNRRPLVLVHLEIYKTASEADKRERELKMPSAGRFKKRLKEKLDL